ncbi:MAG: hypothetical protein ACP5M0_13855 [Desulfomonilaceae bacterium]
MTVYVGAADFLYEQAIQSTAEEFITDLESREIRSSMDRKGRRRTT